MKRIFTFLLLGSVLMLSAFDTRTGIDEVIGALRSGNSTQLSAYFDENVELTLPDKSDSYSKAQAQLIVKDFFGNNGVRGFELKHKGEKAGSNYCVGILQTRGGNFRTTLFMKLKGDKQYLQDISFQQLD